MVLIDGQKRDVSLSRRTRTGRPRRGELLQGHARVFGRKALDEPGGLLVLPDERLDLRPRLGGRPAADEDHGNLRGRLGRERAPPLQLPLSFESSDQLACIRVSLSRLLRHAPLPPAPLEGIAGQAPREGVRSGARPARLVYVHYPPRPLKSSRILTNPRASRHTPSTASFHFIRTSEAPALVISAKSSRRS